MILNYRNIGELEKEYAYGKCFVDGVEIKRVFYIDTEAGLVRTYDIGDERYHTTQGLSEEERERGRKEDWCMPVGGVVSKIVVGVVEVRKLDRSDGTGETGEVIV